MDLTVCLLRRLPLRLWRVMVSLPGIVEEVGIVDEAVAVAVDEAVEVDEEVDEAVAVGAEVEVATAVVGMAALTTTGITTGITTALTMGLTTTGITTALTMGLTMGLTITMGADGVTVMVIASGMPRLKVVDMVSSTSTRRLTLPPLLPPPMRSGDPSSLPLARWASLRILS